MKWFRVAMVGLGCVFGLQNAARAGTVAYDPFASFDFDVTLSNENTAVDAPLSGMGTQYLIVGMQVTDNTTTLTNLQGYWQEFEVPVAPSYEVQIGSMGSSDNSTLSNVGFMISPTEIPLDSLNFNDYPPPSSMGSPLTPIPSLDDLTLSPGANSPDVTLPEPASIGLLGLAALATLARRRRAERLGQN